MYWTIIAINPATEAVETSTFDLPHDGPKAESIASEKLPGKTIVAMVKGNHSTSTYLPAKSLSLYRTERR